MTEIENYVRKVQYYETDKMQITHHSNYVRFMEEARVDFLDKIGYGFKRMESEGIVSPVVSVSLQYKKPTTFGDEIQISVKVKNFTAARVEFEYEMTSGGEIVCTAVSEHCFLGENGRPVSLKKTQPELYALLENLNK